VQQEAKSLLGSGPCDHCEHGRRGLRSQGGNRSHCLRSLLPAFVLDA
jgi:hypothetical protein